MDFEALATLIRTNPDWETLSDDELAEWCNELAVQRIADRVNSDQLYELIDGSIRREFADKPATWRELCGDYFVPEAD